jgi:PAS domain S-box-containing protein
MDRYVTIWRYKFSHTNIVRFWVIFSLVFSSAFITSLAFARHIETIFPQFFYFPILYATYFYRRAGILIAGACAVTYQSLAYYYLFPDPISLSYATGQAILFVCVSVMVAYFLDKMDTIEARYTRIFGDSQIGIVLFDPNTFTITLTNRQLEHMLDYTWKELASMSFHKLFQTNEDQRRFFERLGSGQDITDFETCFVTKNNTPFWVSLSWNRVDRDLISCLVIDINTRKRAHQADNDTFIQYKQIAEISPMGIIVSQNNKITYTNLAFSVFCGYERDYLVGKELAGIIHPDEREKFLDFSKRLQTTMPLPEPAEFKFLSKSGETKPANLFFTPIEQNKKPALLINLVTITMLDYSVFSPRDLITTIIDTGDYSIKADITIDIPPGVTFEADANKISMVIDTFLSHAVNHSKPPRKILITYTSAHNDTFHRLSIKDNGAGITEAQLDQIFNPTQSSDSKILNVLYEQPGLSLPLAKKFIQMHGGYLSVDSIMGLGSTFTINIPKQRSRAVMDSQ